MEASSFNEEEVAEEIAVAVNSGLTRSAVKSKHDEPPKKRGRPPKDKGSSSKPPEPREHKEPKITPAQAASARKLMEEGIKRSEPIDTTKEKLLHKIAKYYEFFPNLLAGSPKDFLRLGERCSNDELEKEVIRCQATLNAGNTLETVKSLDILANSVAEQFLCRLGIPVGGEGLKSLAAAGKESQFIVEQELKEFAVIYEDWFSSGPEWRYLMKKLQLIGTIIKENRSIIAYSSPSPNFDEQELRDKYSDL